MDICTIDFDNTNKWLQYQINRNSLQTNYIVSHFIGNVSPLCQYCGISAEKIAHLYWFCPYVRNFLSESFQYIRSTGINYEPSKLEFLFGVPSVSFDHPKNYISLMIKRYIWKSKFKDAVLNIVGLKSHIKYCLCELKFIYDIKEKAIEFNKWDPLYSDLCQVIQHGSHDVQDRPSPVPVRALLVPATIPVRADASVPPTQVSQAVQGAAEGRV